MKKPDWMPHTWLLEAAVVAGILAGITLLTGNQMREWIGSAAVLFTFMHAQVANKLAEAQEKQPEPSVACYHWVLRYYYGKEVLWLVYFILSQTWAALAGVGLFMLYPLWRKYYKKKYR